MARARGGGCVRLASRCAQIVVEEVAVQTAMNLSRIGSGEVRTTCTLATQQWRVRNKGTTYIQSAFVCAIKLSSQRPGQT